MNREKEIDVRLSTKYIPFDPHKLGGMYYRGHIVKYSPNTGYGFVETAGGKHLFFYADQIRLEGKRANKAEIRAGRVVGFDVGWTDRGLRVSKMKIEE